MNGQLRVESHTFVIPDGVNADGSQRFLPGDRVYALNGKIVPESVAMVVVNYLAAEAGARLDA